MGISLVIYYSDIFFIFLECWDVWLPLLLSWQKSCHTKEYLNIKQKILTRLPKNSWKKMKDWNGYLILKKKTGVNVFGIPKGWYIFFSLKKSIFIFYKQKMTINNSVLQYDCSRSILLSLDLWVLKVSLSSRLMPLTYFLWFKEKTVLGIWILVPLLPLILLYNIRQVLISLS